MFRYVLSVFCVGVLLLVAVSTANAVSIGVKYSRNTDLGANEVAGAPGYTQANWTNAPGTNGDQGPPDYSLLTSLNDNNGTATSVNVTTWTHSGQDYTTGIWYNGWTDGNPITADERLIATYSANEPSISFNGLSTFAPSGYMVVAYYDGTWQTLPMRLTAGAYSHTRDVGVGVFGEYSFAWVEGTDGQPGSPSNYTVFGTSSEPLTSDTFTIEMPPTGGWVGGISAVQIVQAGVQPPSPGNYWAPGTNGAQDATHLATGASKWATSAGVQGFGAQNGTGALIFANDPGLVGTTVDGTFRGEADKDGPG